MPNHISHSQITDFLRCNLKWKLNRQVREHDGYNEDSGTWAQKSGKVVHTVMEMFHHPTNLPRAASDMEIYLPDALEEVPLKPPYLNQVKRTISNFVATFGMDDEHRPNITELEETVPLIEGCDLTVVLDDVTLDHENKEVMIGEYKSSLKDEIDEQEVVWMTYQPFVYQYAASILWPDYVLTKMQYTLLTPKSATRVIRPMWPSDKSVWIARLATTAQEMMRTRGNYIFPNYSWNCKWCDHWKTHCEPKLLLGG